jgi:hypothetical protein
MLRFVARHGLLRYGLVRVAGRRVVPVMLAWDLLMIANRTRQIPIVDRNLRRGAVGARDRLAGAAAGRSSPFNLRRPGRRRGPDA